MLPAGYTGGGRLQLEASQMSCAEKTPSCVHAAGSRRKSLVVIEIKREFCELLAPEISERNCNSCDEIGGFQVVGAGAIEPAFVGQQINTEALPRLISPNTSRISGLGARHAVRYVSKKAHQKDLWVMGCDFASPLTAPDTSTFRSSTAGNFRTVAFTSAGNVHPQGRRLLFNYGTPERTQTWIKLGGRVTPTGCTSFAPENNLKEPR